MSYEKLIDIEKIDDYCSIEEIVESDERTEEIQNFEAMLQFQQSGLTYEDLEGMIKVQNFLTKPGPTNLSNKITEARKIETIPATEFDYI